MRDAFLSGGVLMWPMLLTGLGIVALAARTAWVLARPGSALGEAERRLRAIVFWGGMSVVLGTLGTVVGLMQVAQALARAGAVHAPLVWGGFGVSLVTLIFGLLIFLLSLLLWYGLRQWYVFVSVRNRRGLPAA